MIDITTNIQNENLNVCNHVLHTCCGKSRATENANINIVI